MKEFFLSLIKEYITNHCFQVVILITITTAVVHDSECVYKMFSQKILKILFYHIILFKFIRLSYKSIVKDTTMFPAACLEGGCKPRANGMFCCLSRFFVFVVVSKSFRERAFLFPFLYIEREIILY